MERNNADANYVVMSTDWMLVCLGPIASADATIFGTFYISNFILSWLQQVPSLEHDKDIFSSQKRSNLGQGWTFYRN